MNWFIPLAIELGDFTTLSEQSGLADFGWFFGGVAVLGGLTMLTLRWSNQSRRDPFEDFEDFNEEGDDADRTDPADRTDSANRTDSADHGDQTDRRDPMV